MPVVYQTGGSVLLRAIGGGLVAALVIGVAWGFLIDAGLGRFGAAYDWSFWFSLILGFGVAETTSWLANRKRGSNLQLVGIGSVLLGFVVSRVVLNARGPRSISLAQFLSDPLNAAAFLRIELLTLLFLALACAIAWRRFR